MPVLDLGVEIQLFGPIVVIGILLGAELMQRYGQRHGMTTHQGRALLGWVIVSGFIGAHWVEILAYAPHRLRDEGPLVLLRLWDGISSFGGFLGGAVGLLLFARRHRLGAGLVFDTTGVGLLVAFSVGRIGCTLVHDHIGRATDFRLGIDYPRAALVAHGVAGALGLPPETDVLRAHNLGMYELACLMPINVVILTLAFRSRRRLVAGQLAVLTTLLYAPIRFGLEFLRVETSDPRYVGLTIAQWGALVAFAAVAIVGARSLAAARPAGPAAPGAAA